MKDSRQLYQRKITPVVEAYRWYKNGDHPQDGVGEDRKDPLTGDTYKSIEGAVVRFFRRPEPEYAGHLMHEKCDRTWHEHGWIDTPSDCAVCPGDWVLKNVNHRPVQFFSISNAEFSALYEPFRSCDATLVGLTASHQMKREWPCSLPLGHADGWHESPQEGLPPVRWRDPNDEI